MAKPITRRFEFEELITGDKLRYLVWRVAMSNRHGTIKSVHESYHGVRVFTLGLTSAYPHSNFRVQPNGDYPIIAEFGEYQEIEVAEHFWKGSGVLMIPYDEEVSKKKLEQFVRDLKEEYRLAVETNWVSYYNE